MKQNVIQLSQQHAAALGKHVKQGPRTSLRPASELRGGATSLGLLLGINVRPLALKPEDRNQSGSLKNSIANSQQLVSNSVRSERQACRKLGRL